MPTFLSLLQLFIIIGLLGSWIAIIIYFRNKDNHQDHSHENKAFWLFVYLLSSLIVASIILFKLSAWKTKTTPKEQHHVTSYTINTKSQDFIRKIHSPLANKQKQLQKILQTIDKTVQEINNIMLQRQNHKAFLENIINLYEQESNQITNTLRAIEINSQNAMIQATTTQNTRIVEREFYKQSIKLLQKATASQKHFHQQESYISSLISDTLKRSRKQLAKQQRYIPSITNKQNNTTFSEKNSQILQRYTSVINSKLSIRLKIIADEYLKAKKNTTTLDSLITELNNSKLKEPLEKARILWIKSRDNADQRQIQILSALESAYLAYQFGMPQSNEVHSNLIRQINGASQQFIREIQALNEKAEQSYYTPKL